MPKDCSGFRRALQLTGSLSPFQTRNLKTREGSTLFKVTQEARDPPGRGLDSQLAVTHRPTPTLPWPVEHVLLMVLLGPQVDRTENKVLFH